ncbi:MAG: hypothetical protein PHS37_06235 [Candidatus Omnitrophica bacterium]|nr:hypothetical protein [Candidatus Omnitrophota bacterium]
MKKKTTAKSAKKELKMKKGEKYVCDSCGMAVTVDRACECGACDIICCGENMRMADCCC